MKKNNMIVTVILAFALLTTLFAMSDGGNNDPTNQTTQEVKQDIQNIHAEHSDQAKSNEKIKDRLGIDTGMTKEEYDKFKEEYRHFAEKLGITKSSKYGYDTYFDWKVNLTKNKELETLHVNINNIGAPSSHTSHYENTVYSDVVLIGEISDVVYVEDQPFYKSIYKVNVLDVLKGKELIKDEFGNKISILSKNGKTFYSSDTTEMKVGETRLFFLSYKLGSEDKFASRSLSERIIKDGKLYDREGKKTIGNLDDEIIKIKKIIEINDSDNFYKRSYKVEE